MTAARIGATITATIATIVVLGAGGPAAAAPPPEVLKREVLATVGELRTLTQQMVDQIFSYGELGFEEEETSRYVTGLLEREGFQVTRGVAGIPTAWVARWGSGKPVVGFIADLDGIPKASQTPGVAFHKPLVEGGPGHGEGHNAGQAVNVTAALALKRVMERHKLPGELRLYPGVAEELLGTKAFLVREHLLDGVDVVLGAHVDNAFGTHYGQRTIGLVSVQYTFTGRPAHAGTAPWLGRSALDAVELMNVGWNVRREHLRPEHRSHYVIINGGDQPNVVPEEAAVWYYLRETTAAGVRGLYDTAGEMARAAAAMTGTEVRQRTVGSAWPEHFSKPIAEAQQKNLERVGMPVWSAEDEQLAKGLQRELGVAEEGLAKKVKPLEPIKDLMGGSDDIGDLSWTVPTVYLRYPANIPGLPGHHWANAVSMATPIAHKGATAGAQAQAATALDVLTSPALVKRAWDYLRTVQGKNVRYEPLIARDDQPAIELNHEKMARFRPALRKFHFDPSRHRTYLEQLGVKYPTLRAPAAAASASR